MEGTAESLALTPLQSPINLFIVLSRVTIGELLIHLDIVLNILIVIYYFCIGISGCSAYSLYTETPSNKISNPKMSTDSIVKTSNWRLVEVGRVVLVKNTGKLATIVEIIDQKKVCYKMEEPYL